MCHVAAEMERQGFELPLLIGGATTSRVHTAVKIHPNYRRGQTVYVNDASRAVGVAQALMSARRRRGYVAELRGEYAKIAAAHARAQEDKPRLPLADGARQCAQARLVRRYAPPKPSFLGTQGARRLSDRRAGRLHRLDAVLPDLGADRQIPGHPRRRQVRRGGARRSTTTRSAMLDKIVAESWFKAQRGASASGRPTREATTSCVFADETRGEPLATLHTLRQQLSKREGRANVALADFVAPRDSGVADYIGAFAVTAGIGEDEVAERFKRANDDYSADHGQGAGRPAGGSLRRAAAPARAQGVLGLRAGRDADAAPN